MKLSIALLAAALLAACAPAAPIATPQTYDAALVQAAWPFMQGTIVPTQSPTDLAINGDAFFVLSRQASPASLDDIVFTREGVFHFEFEPGTARDAQGNLIRGTGTFELVNKDGYFVMGYRYDAIENVRPFGHPPEEHQGQTLPDLDTITLPDAQGQPPKSVPLAPLTVNLAQNPAAANNFSFDTQGLLHIKGVAPRADDGSPENVFVAVASVPVRMALRRVVGTFNATHPYFAYQPAAGPIRIGVAGTGNTLPDKLVGSKNTLTPMAAEQLPPLDTLDQVLAELHPSSAPSSH